MHVHVPYTTRPEDFLRYCIRILLIMLWVNSISRRLHSSAVDSDCGAEGRRLAAHVRIWRGGRGGRRQAAAPDQELEPLWLAPGCVLESDRLSDTACCSGRDSDNTPGERLTAVWLIACAVASAGDGFRFSCGCARSEHRPVARYPGSCDGDGCERRGCA